jgi:hypothetical protein
MRLSRRAYNHAVRRRIRLLPAEERHMTGAPQVFLFDLRRYSPLRALRLSYSGLLPLEY